MNVLRINVGRKKYYEEKSKEFGPISYSLNYHLNKQTYKLPVMSSMNSVCISTGPFMGLNIPGTHRLIISARSPQIHTFFMSTLGGGSIELSKTGFNTIVIEGKARDKTIVLIKNVKGKLTVFFDKINKIPLNTIKFQQKLIKKYSKTFKGLKYRALVVGAASIKTNMGAVHSVKIRDNKIDYGSEGWAGRGGMGSLLLQAHNVAAVIFGGDYEFKSEINAEKVFNKVFKKNMVKVIYEATDKYRFVDKLGTGGTYGVNFFYQKDKTLWFNWQNMMMDRKVREELYDKYIRHHYLKGFNEEVIKNKSFKTCGEACSAVCKKVWNNRSNDYEPCIACGPLCGIFDRRDMEVFAGAVDDLGFDAIEVGNLTAYVFENVAKGVFKKEAFLMRYKPVMNPDATFKDSKRNARIAAKFVKDLALGKIPVLEKGIRAASKRLKQRSSAVYMSYGRNGVISPNMYFVPGFLVPLPVQGKFHTNYSSGFITPRELGRTSAERAVKELYSEEGGVCRFHRAWSEKLVPILASMMGFKELFARAKRLVKGIIKYNKLAGAEPVYYETKRSKELLYYHITSYLEDNPYDENALGWKKMFEKDFEKTSKKYWSELVKGVEEVIR
ncbi:MAG: hypothetical protein JW791_01895 [Nanoarchaeota archaeon]|nr:hypothetical protein [Nanoarchaeota archaeon]